jgi:cell division protein FtsA
MITRKQFIAFDLGSSKISAMAAEMLENGELKILSAESKASDDVKWGIVEQHTGAAFKVSELLRYLQNSAKIPDISMVSVSVGAKSMKLKSDSVSRFVGKPNIITEKLLIDMAHECERKIQNGNLEIFDTIPVSYFVDGKRMDSPEGKTASQIIGNYHIIIGSSNIKSQRDRCFEKTGLVVEHTPLAVEALSTVLLEEQEREVGCALINLGATTTTLAVYHDGALQHLLVVPLGAKNITKDIEELGVSEAHAERLKCLKGVALQSLVKNPMYVQIPSIHDETPAVKISTDFLATIIEARLEEILQPIFDAIDALPYSLDAGIVISGGGSKMNHLIDFIAEKTGIYARFGNHSDWLSHDTPEKFLDPIYAQLIGTILLTDEYRQQHPIEETIVDPVKGPKIPTKGRGFGEKITNRFLDFFGDENKLN